MKRVTLFLLVALPVALMAQVNEMFYVPKKEVKQENVAKMLSAGAAGGEWGVADNGNTRDVDEYNRRRSTTSVAAGDVETLLQQESAVEYVYEEDTDYDYSTRIVRFHNPTTVIVGSPWYYDVYPSYGCYDYYDNGWWDWSIGWGSHGWSINAGWHWPFFSWHWGGGQHHHPHYNPPHVASSAPGHRVQQRVPTVSVAGKGGSGRQPVATAAGDKKPTVQVGNGNGGRIDRDAVDGGSRERGRVNSSSTYNRRSSTSVRKENAGNSNRNDRTVVDSKRGGSDNNRSSVRSSSGSSNNNRSSVRSSSVGGASRASSSRGGRR